MSKQILPDSPVEVFSGSAWDAALIQSLLENAEIGVYPVNTGRGSYAPASLSPSGTTHVRVFVSGSELEKAMEVVQQYKRNKKQDHEPGSV